MSTSSAGAAPHVAIVGSGPSGCYAAQMLRKQLPSADITVFDRLPVPFGLLRYGVAPDHQHTKQLAHQFSRLFQGGEIRFAGNVQVGRDVTIEQLQECFDVVVLATGLWTDRRLGVPGEDLPGVVGAGQLMRWVNAHPDEAEFAAKVGDRVVVVGAGNVAVDAVRMLVKNAEHFGGSDIPDHVVDGLKPAAQREIHVVARSSAALAKFDVAMIKELGTIPGVAFEFSDATVEAGSEAADPKVAALQNLLPGAARDEARAVVSFHFGWTPARVRGGEGVEGMTFVDPRGSDELDLAADSVVTAIGFVEDPEDALLAVSPSRPGDGTDRARLAPGLYSCGWFRRGATGSIPTNRACAKEVVAHIVSDLKPDALPERPGYAGIEALLPGTPTSFEGWQRVDAAEVAAADEGRVRRKFADWAALLEVANEVPLHQNHTAASQ